MPQEKKRQLTSQLLYSVQRLHRYFSDGCSWMKSGCSSQIMLGFREYCISFYEKRANRHQNKTPMSIKVGVKNWIKLVMIFVGPGWREVYAFPGLQE